MGEEKKEEKDDGDGRKEAKKRNECRSMKTDRKSYQRNAVKKKNRLMKRKKYRLIFSHNLEILRRGQAAACTLKYDQQWYSRGISKIMSSKMNDLFRREIYR